MIDKKSPVPIYHQLAEVIKKKIEENVLSSGEMIPSEREYAEKYQISRMTVRQALNNLVHDGYLSRVKGKGTFVESKKMEQTLQGVTSFTEDMLSRGLEPSTKLLGLEKLSADKSVANRLDIEEGDSIYQLKRIRLADGIPMAIELNYLPKKLVGELNETIVQKSLYQYIEEDLSLSIHRATQMIEASISRKEESEHLQIPSKSPVLLIERTSYLDSGNVIEFVQSIYRADRYKFLSEMTRKD